MRGYQQIYMCRLRDAEIYYERGYVCLRQEMFSHAIADYNHAVVYNSYLVYASWNCTWLTTASTTAGRARTSNVKSLILVRRMQT